MAEYYIYHAGIKGMKWGVRRYQNKDGSLTPAGKKRMRLRAKRSVDSDSFHEDYKKAHDKKSVSQMSDQELRERNNRLQAEKQYRDLTKKTSKGKKFVKAYIATAGTIAGVATATATYKKMADKGIDKVGDMIIKNLDKGLKGPLH